MIKEFKWSRKRNRKKRKKEEELKRGKETKK